MREVTYEDLMNNVRGYIEEDKSLEIISKAFECAKKLHEGQKRQSGEIILSIRFLSLLYYQK